MTFVPRNKLSVPTQSHLRTFYFLALAQTISQIGSSMTFLAVGIYVYHQTRQATPLALLSIFLLLPRILVSGITGAMADRYSRRTQMLIGDCGAAIGLVWIAWNMSSGNFQLWHLYAGALWQAVFNTMQRSAFEPSVSQLVPDSQRHRANAILQAGGPIALLLSSALTGLAYKSIGVAGILLIDLISFFIAISVTLLVRIPAPPRSTSATQTGGSILNEWVAGLQFLWLRSPLFILTLQVALFGFFISSVFALMTPYVLARTGSETMLGILNATLSMGGIVGAVLISVWSGFKRRIDTIMVTMILVLIAIMLFGTNLPFAVLAATLFMAMMGIVGVNAISMALLQCKVPSDVQGRIFAISTQLALVLTPLGYLLIGPLADKVFTPLAASPDWEKGPVRLLFGVGAAGGMGAMFTVSAGLALVTTLITYALPTVRDMEATLPTYSNTVDIPDPPQE